MCSVCVTTCACVYTYMAATGQYPVLPFLFTILVLQLSLELTNWPASSRDPPVSASPVLGLQARATVLSYFIWVLII